MSSSLLAFLACRMPSTAFQRYAQRAHGRTGLVYIPELLGAVPHIDDISLRICARPPLNLHLVAGRMVDRVSGPVVDLRRGAKWMRCKMVWSMINLSQAWHPRAGGPVEGWYLWHTVSTLKRTWTRYHPSQTKSGTPCTAISGETHGQIRIPHEVKTNCRAGSESSCQPSARPDDQPVLIYAHGHLLVILAGMGAVQGG